MHEADQNEEQTYWRVVIPDNQDTQDAIIEGNTLCTIFGTSGIYEDAGGYQEVFLLESHDAGGTPVRS